MRTLTVSLIAALLLLGCDGLWSPKAPGDSTDETIEDGSGDETTEPGPAVVSRIKAEIEQTDSP